MDATQDLSALQAFGKAVALAVADTFVLHQAAINPARNVLSSNAVAADLLVELLAKLHLSKKQVPSWDQVWLLKLRLLIHFRVTGPACAVIGPPGLLIAFLMIQLGSWTTLCRSCILPKFDNCEYSRGSRHA